MEINNQDITKKQLKQISRFLKQNLNISRRSFSEKYDGNLSPSGIEENAKDHGVNLRTMFEEIADKQKAARRETLRHIGLMLVGGVMAGLGFATAVLAMPNVGGAMICIGLLSGLAAMIAPTPEENQARESAQDCLYALTGGGEITGGRFLNLQPAF